jgi:hypothetical protein
MKRKRKWPMHTHNIKKIIIVKTLILISFICTLVATAVPRYVNLQRNKEASECQHNQVLVETALALAYAESLAVDSSEFPEHLTAIMFEDGIIPTCPHTQLPITFDSATGAAFCPSSIPSHNRTY